MILGISCIQMMLDVFKCIQLLRYSVCALASMKTSLGTIFIAYHQTNATSQRPTLCCSINEWSGMERNE